MRGTLGGLGCANIAAMRLMQRPQAAVIAALTLLPSCCAVIPNEPKPALGSIVFSSDRSGRFQLYTCAEDGADVRPLSMSEIDDTNPRWSPSGDRLAFVADGTLSLLDPETGTRQSLDVVADPDVPISWSPTGHRLICMSGGQLLCVDIGTKRVSKVAPESLHATWMPGSEQLLATRGQIPFLQVMAGDEFIRYFLQEGFRTALIPQLFATWSRADPPRCAFSSSTIRIGSNVLAYDVFMADADGKPLKSVFSTDGTDWACDWSPDGTALLTLSEKDDVSDIFVVWVDTGRQVNLTNDAALEMGASWRP